MPCFLFPSPRFSLSSLVCPIPLVLFPEAGQPGPAALEGAGEAVAVRAVARRLVLLQVAQVQERAVAPGTEQNSGSSARGSGKDNGCKIAL